MGCAPGSGFALVYGPKAAPGGLAQTSENLDGEAQPRLTSGGKAGVEGVKFQHAASTSRRYLTSGGKAATNRAYRLFVQSIPQVTELTTNSASRSMRARNISAIMRALSPLAIL